MLDDTFHGVHANTLQPKSESGIRDCQLAIISYRCDNYLTLSLAADNTYSSGDNYFIAVQLLDFIN